MEKEVRFALVLYGGVSLAVYMNGVTQEFFHLVRSTAPNAAGEPTGTEAVYRKLAGIVKSRFVVDILSGSSAGGINAIFLGKALANGQNLDDLSRLWLDEADLNDLWNKSFLPRSVLSGKAMYGMLANALQAMDDSGASNPLQSEIDVFITTTDIQGLELPIQLSDTAVAEKRHKNVFHFSQDEFSQGGFSRNMNPILAFAGRATSSFPLAFEPARLKDYAPATDADKFFPDYVEAGAGYARRAFGDGGYLNNKPFNYALGEIPQRVSDRPMRRMLVYVEPTPERSTGNGTKAAPGPIQNSIEALVTLHQYETIREDLQQVLDRNRLIERVKEITNQVERDVENWQTVPRLTGPAYARRTLSEEIHARGPGYAGYHRLKVHAVTDELARLTGCSSRAVEEWRAKIYREEDVESSESLFLLHFDLGYRQRRLRFLLAKLNETEGSEELRRELTQIARTLVFRESYDITTIRKSFREIMIPAAGQIEQCLAGHPLKRYFDRYEDYDQVTFPIFYETGVGEAEPVEVFRVSPLDARTVIDETSPLERRRKLAGTALFHFGAFLKRDWRLNDMLWGRLDGAERIICSVLPPGSKEVSRLIRDAHLAILQETFGDQAERMYGVLKTSYEVDRRFGFLGVLKLLRGILITLKLCVLPVTR